MNYKNTYYTIGIDIEDVLYCLNSGCGLGFCEKKYVQERLAQMKERESKGSVYHRPVNEFKIFKVDLTLTECE
jgi:hypothetical protein